MRKFNFPDDVNEWTEENVDAVHELCGDFYQQESLLRQECRRAEAMTEKVMQYLSDLDRAGRRISALEAENIRLNSQLNEEIFRTMDKAHPRTKADYDRFEGWGWTKGTYTYGQLRDMLTAAGYMDLWDLSTSREDLERLIHTHIHLKNIVRVAYSCPACKAERDRP